jgi:hypothetical protein
MPVLAARRSSPGNAFSSPERAPSAESRAAFGDRPRARRSARGRAISLRACAVQVVPDNKIAWSTLGRPRAVTRSVAGESAWSAGSASRPSSGRFV